jgi:hypothetical protein
LFISVISRSIKILTLVLFVTAIYSPLVGTLLGYTSDLTMIENRKLADFPSLHLDRPSILNMPKSLEAYFDDHLFLRDKLIWLHNYLLVFWLHSSPTPDVLIGKETWLFYNKHNLINEHNGQNPLSKTALNELTANLQTAQQWLAAKDIRFLFVPAPDKMTIYPEYLGLDNSHSKLNQLISALKDDSPQVNVLDLRPALLDEKLHHIVYYPYGTHWNDYGAYRAYREIMFYLRRWYPQLDILSLADMQYKNRDAAAATRDDEGVNDDGNAKLLDLPDQFLLKETHFEPRPDLQGKWINIGFPKYYNSYISWKRPFGYAKSGKPLRLLIFRDSFARWLTPFLAASFGESTFVRGTATKPIVEYWVKRTHPDIVIIEIVERYI